MALFKCESRSERGRPTGAGDQMDGKGDERKWKEEEGRYLCDEKAARGCAEARCLIGGAPNPGGQTPARLLRILNEEYKDFIMKFSGLC